MDALKIFIPGEPVACQRPRFRNVRGQIWTYDPQEKEKANNRMIITNQLKSKEVYFPEGNPLGIRFTFVMLPPAKVTKAENCQYSWGLIPVLKKPDLDNFEKFYLDVMTGIVYKDDAFITEMASKKEFSSDSVKAGVYIFIYPLEKKYMTESKEEECVKKSFTVQELSSLENVIAEYRQGNKWECLSKLAEYVKNFDSLRKYLAK